MIEAAKGNGKPSAAGIRIDGKKHMLTYHDEESGCSQLVSEDGGAAVANIATAVIIGIFKKDRSSDKKSIQTIHDTVAQVEAMAAYLKEQGF